MAGGALDVEAVRAEFSLLARAEAPLWFDSAASAHKPQRVVDAQYRFLTE